MHRPTSSIPSLLIIAASLFATSCSREHEAEGGQVFAIIDDKELTAPMVDTALTQLPQGLDPKNGHVQKAVLQQLVDETLLAKQAEDMKLDKTPAMQRALEAARRTLLANAYLAKSAGDIAPTDASVIEFFSSHPYLFADRKGYTLDVVQLRASPEKVQRYITAFHQPGMTVNALAAQMNREGISATVNQSPVTADQVPDAVARQLSQSKPGDGLTYRSGDVQSFIQVASIAPSPVPLAEARVTIAQFLAEKRRQEQRSADLKQLRAAANIQYRGVGKKIMAQQADAPAKLADNSFQ